MPLVGRIPRAVVAAQQNCLLDMSLTLSRSGCTRRKPIHCRFVVSKWQSKGGDENFCDCCCRLMSRAEETETLVQLFGYVNRTALMDT